MDSPGIAGLFDLFIKGFDESSPRGSFTRLTRVGLDTGLPLAVELGRSGFDTTGFDLEQRKVDSVHPDMSFVVSAVEQGRERRE